MKLNKTLMITAVVAGSLFTGSLALMAQDSPTTNSPAATAPTNTTPRMRGGFDMVARQLQLTDDQKTKVQPIFEDMQQQIKDLRGDSTLSMTEKRAKMKDIRTATTAKLKALNILSDDQLAQWQKMGPGNRRPAMVTPPAAEGSTPPASTTTPPATSTPASTDSTK